MTNQEFTVGALNRLRRKGKQFCYRTDSGEVLSDGDAWTSFLQSLSGEILRGEFRFRTFESRVSRNGKLLFSTKSLENIMVIRKINDNIRRVYRVKQANRFETIRQIRQALRETTPKFITRIDIRSFYESIPCKVLVNKLRTEKLVSTRTIELLSALLSDVRRSGAVGLPRGLQVSATLAELYGSMVESDLRAIHGVYHVARYVDDIVVFSFLATETVFPCIEKSLQLKGLRLNREKLQLVSVQCRCAEGCVHGGKACSCADRCKCKVEINENNLKKIDFLGYRIAFPDVNRAGADKQNEVGIYLAKKKISKYKKRIVLAVLDFKKTADFDLLKDRVEFLTSNHRLHASKCGDRLKSGIYYNFSQYQPFSDPRIFKGNRLEELDEFLKGSLLCALKGASVARKSKRAVVSMSFVRGHAQRRTRKFEPKRLAKIGECWSET